MLKDIKKTTKHTSIYALGNIATKIIGLILVPLYTDLDRLSSDDYGALAVLEATSLLLIGLLKMGMGAGLTRWYWDKNITESQKSIFFTTLAFLAATTLAATAVLYPLSKQLSVILLDSESFTYLVKLTILVSAIQIINNQVLQLARLQYKSSLYASMQILKLTLVLGLILWGIIIKGKGLDAIWEANLIGEALVFLLLMPYALKNCEFTLQFKILKEMVIYGLPLMFASVSGVILTSADRIMLSSMSGLEDTGIYSLGYRIANTLKIVITASLTSALGPLKMQKMHTTGNQIFYAKTNTYSLFLFAFALLGLSLFSLEIVSIVSSSQVYIESNFIIPIIGYALFFGLFKDNLKIGLTIKKQTKIIGSAILISSIANILLNLILIRHFNIYGAATATLLSQILFFIIITFFAQKAYPIPYEWRKITLLLIISIAFVLTGLMCAEINILLRIFIKTILFLSFPFILKLFNFYDKIELQNINQVLSNWKNIDSLKSSIKRLKQQ